MLVNQGIQIAFFLAVVFLWNHTYSEDNVGCSENKYGPECMYFCHCASDPNCLFTNGECQQCEQGWHGPTCQMENVALNKLTKLKNYNNSLALKSVDGDRSTCFRKSDDSSLMRMRVQILEIVDIHNITIFTSANKTGEAKKDMIDLDILLSTTENVVRNVCYIETREIPPDGRMDMNCQGQAKNVFIRKKTYPMLLDICEVEIYVCAPYTWGINCQNFCGKCRDNDKCDQNTGMCPGGCDDGWMGLHCQTRQDDLKLQNQPLQPNVEQTTDTVLTTESSTSVTTAQFLVDTTSTQATAETKESTSFTASTESTETTVISSTESVKATSSTLSESVDTKPSTTLTESVDTSSTNSLSFDTTPATKYASTTEFLDNTSKTSTESIDTTSTKSEDTTSTASTESEVSTSSQTSTESQESTESVDSTYSPTSNESVDTTSSQTSTESEVSTSSQTSTESVDSTSSQTSSESVDTTSSQTSTESVDSTSSQTSSESVDTTSSQTSTESVDTTSSQTSTESEVSTSSQTSTESVDTTSTQTPTESVDTKSSQTSTESVDTTSSQTSTESVDTTSSQTSTESEVSTSSQTSTESVDSTSSQTYSESVDTTLSQTSTESVDSTSSQTSTESVDSSSSKTSTESVDSSSSHTSTESEVSTSSQTYTESVDTSSLTSTELVDYSSSTLSDVFTTLSTETTSTFIPSDAAEEMSTITSHPDVTTEVSVLSTQTDESLSETSPKFTSTSLTISTTETGITMSQITDQVTTLTVTPYDSSVTTETTVSSTESVEVTTTNDLSVSDNPTTTTSTVVTTGTSSDMSTTTTGSGTTQSTTESSTFVNMQTTESGTTSTVYASTNDDTVSTTTADMVTTTAEVTTVTDTATLSSTSGTAVETTNEATTTAIETTPVTSPSTTVVVSTTSPNMDSGDTTTETISSTIASVDNSASSTTESVESLSTTATSSKTESVDTTPSTTPNNTVSMVTTPDTITTDETAQSATTVTMSVDTTAVTTSSSTETPKVTTADGKTTVTTQNITTNEDTTAVTTTNVQESTESTIVASTTSMDVNTTETEPTNSQTTAAISNQTVTEITISQVYNTTAGTTAEIPTTLITVSGTSTGGTTEVSTLTTSTPEIDTGNTTESSSYTTSTVPSSAGTTEPSSTITSPTTETSMETTTSEVITTTAESSPTTTSPTTESTVETTTSEVRTTTTGTTTVYETATLLPTTKPVGTTTTMMPNITTVTTENTTNSVGAITAIVIPVIILFVLVVVVIASLLLVIGRRRSKRQRKFNGDVPLTGLVTNGDNGYVPVDDDAFVYDDEMHDSVYDNVLQSKPIPVSMLQETLKDMQETNQFQLEYNNLPDDHILPVTISRQEINFPKNRYTNMLPFNHSRVKLKNVPEGQTDFINANYINGYGKKKAYIATQGPMEKTTIDFWWMVWEQNVKKIIMVTNLKERNRIKCYQYWPKEREELACRNLTVTLESEIEFPSYIIRKIKILDTKTQSKRQITQFHFTAWPDHGVPDPFQLLSFHRKVSTNGFVNDPEPWIVHCSAGVGRTGTFLALDALLKEGLATESVDVLAFVRNMRKNRMKMVQTLDQYIFIHFVLMEAFACMDAALAGDTVTSTFNGPSDPKYIARIENEFEKLNSLRPEYNEKNIKDAVHPNNIDKNRSQDVLPVDNYRVRLFNTSDGTDYMNAVIMPTCGSRQGYIVTQYPLPNTIDDFWNMVSSYSCNTIVLLDDSKDFEVQFYPSMEETAEFGPVTLEMLSTKEHQDCVTETTLSLTNQDSGEELDVKIFTGHDWSLESNTPPSAKLLHCLHYEIQKCQAAQATPSPIIVICRDGSKQCGLFCAVCNILDGIDWYNEMNVFHTIRQLQIRRPQFISTKSQYEYCYNIAMNYLDTSAVYENTDTIDYVNVETVKKMMT